MDNGLDLLDSSEKIKLLQSLMKNKNWELFKFENGISTERKYLKNSDIACFRSSAYIDTSAEDLLDYVTKIYDTFESVNQYDQDVVQYEIIKKLTDESRLCYQINSMPWPIWFRDLLYIQIIKKIDNAYWFYMYSVESDIKPKDESKYVRAIVNISAYIFFPENSGCRIYRIAHIDPSGSIPTNLINNYADKTSTVIKRLKQLYPNN